MNTIRDILMACHNADGKPAVFETPLSRAAVIRAELHGCVRVVESQRHHLSAVLTDKGRNTIRRLISESPKAQLRETAGAGLIIDRGQYH